MNNSPIKNSAQHDSADSCWSALYGTVYDLTNYASDHPRRGGGAANVFRLCGIDGTKLYDDFHGRNKDYLKSFSNIKDLGQLEDETSPPTPNPTDSLITHHPENVVSVTTDPNAPLQKTIPPTFSTEVSTNDSLPLITTEETAIHNDTDDCWIIYGDDVYNMTEYGPQHPAGEAIVFLDCGGNGTDALDASHDRNYLPMIHDLLLGVVEDGIWIANATDANQTLLDTGNLSLSETAVGRSLPPPDSRGPR